MVLEKEFVITWTIAFVFGSLEIAYPIHYFMFTLLYISQMFLFYNIYICNIYTMNMELRFIS